MSERAWPRDYEGPNWRSLRDAIAFISRHFNSVRKAETKLYPALVSCDVLSVLERADGVRERLTYWGEIEFSITSYIDRPGELVRDDDIEIARGLKALDPNLIFVWWPDIESLCKLAGALEPHPKPQPEPVKDEQAESVEGEPTLRQRMIVAILREEYGDDFTTDYMAGKEAVIRDHWGAKCTACHVSYPLPHRTTIEYTIKDYLKRPSVYLKRRIEAT